MTPEALLGEPNVVLGSEHRGDGAALFVGVLGLALRGMDFPGFGSSPAAVVVLGEVAVADGFLEASCDGLACDAEVVRDGGPLDKSVAFEMVLTQSKELGSTHWSLAGHFTD